MPAFIETQFPIARLSAESYKERKANNGQTLTRLGKWWERKPLILVRASILGLLMPASGDAKKDREIFLKILTMDDEGTWQRCKPAVQRKTSRAAFDALPYAVRLGDCERPENIEDPTAAAWAEINAHLNTTAKNLPELVEQLGIACDTLIPRGLDTGWRELSLVERYYLRALDIESRGERRKGMYEELARGFGVTDIRPLLKSDKANGTRLFTPSGLAVGLLGTMQAADAASLPARRGRAGTAGPHPFAVTPLRHLLFAIRETAAADRSPKPGRQYLRDTFGQGYWSQREAFVYLLDWLAALGNAEGMGEWVDDSTAARLLAGRLRNDQA